MRCGSVRVPLDWSRPRGETTTVAYAYLPRRAADRPSAGTVAFVVGGPGGPAIPLADQVVGLLDPLLADHDLVLMDPRGTGASRWLDCGIRADALVSPRRQRLAEIGRCGETLGARAGHYTSAAIADDLDAVRARVGAPRLDLFGISYGTYLSAEYARRHPRRVDSVVLSGAFPIAHDTWKRPNAAAIARALDLVCAPGGCQAATVRRDLDRVLTMLRKRPIPYPVEIGGVARTATLDEAALANVMYNASNLGKWERWGQLPAVLHAAAAGSTGRLVELARAELLDDYPVPGPESGVSAAQAFAVMCNDYPTAYDRKAPVGVREAQYRSRRSALDPRPFAPFTAAGWTDSMDEGTDTCIRWTANRRLPEPSAGGFPDVPVLALTGALDANTTSAEAAAAAGQFRRGIVVEVPNAAHIPNLEPTGCASQIAENFIRFHRTGDLGCLAGVPPIPVEPY